MRSSKLLALALALALPSAWAQQSVITPATTKSIPIVGTVAPQTQLIAGIPGQSIYVTSFDLVPAPTSTIQFTQGTGTNCVTGTTIVHAATDLGPGVVLSKGGGSGAQWVLQPGNSLCITIQTNPAPGSLAYSLVTAGAVSSVLWTPANDPIWIAWWDASDLPHLTFNGSNISAWTDRIGSVVAAQGTGANQPGWSATALNNKPGLIFDTTKLLPFSSSSFPAGTSTVTLSAAGVVADSGSTYRFIEYGSSGAIRGLASASGSANEAINLNAAIPALTGTIVWTSQLFVVATIANNAQGLFANGMTDSTAAVTLATSGSLGNIGAKFDGTAGLLKGTIQQIVIGNAVPSTAQRQCLEGWESWWDGKSGTNLPSNHPFKNAPPIVGGGC